LSFSTFHFLEHHKCLALPTPDFLSFSGSIHLLDLSIGVCIKGSTMQNSNPGTSNLRPLRSRILAVHKQQLEGFATDVQKAVKLCLPTDLERYQKAAVFAFDWSNDTMGVAPLRDEFLTILHKVYNFKIEHHQLDASLTSFQLGNSMQNRTRDFVKKYKSNREDVRHLLLFYYSGHADSGPRGDTFRLS
jgi:hypothetical protein